MVQNFPVTRLRRLRATPAMRDLFQEQTLSVNDLIYPIFVEEDLDDFAPVESMPGIWRIPERKLDTAIKEIAAVGIKAIMTFGVSHHKDATGSDAMKRDGLTARMVKRAKDAAPDLVVMSDTCFCEYTSHGHCGVIVDGDVHNDHTIENLGIQAVIAAEAGADMIAPSSMMDGQVTAIRKALDGAGFVNTPIMSYSSKFASAYYGPFRAAAGCDLEGDRKAYQMNPMNVRESLRESDIDEAEGADVLMVKPAGPYLDVLIQIKQRSLLPLAAYQVSGEYAMIKFAAAAGAIDEERVMLESLGAIKRAGADLILTYFAMDVARRGL
ncbi:porphobilinogen synthase [Rhodopila globiformis]|uniref:Delta-aminolevulinic acid dehydratase n=1 Tax=Rhodopila globiformis TaxID=1071 RepID=A0A2S6N952_RHOGL|nr:porphobilinogen synthase [Rhodopila globiformis]PPQ31145.1 delta-aminolevulinic acid dehydratase [Rhodopila globiformis]